MAMNRIQFQPGLSLPEFLSCYGTEQACRQAVFQARWPDGFRCPRCQSAEHTTFVRGQQPIWQCRACRRQTSLTAGTIFAHLRMPLMHWFMGLYLMSQSKNSIAALELARYLGVCYRTAWRMKHKVMQVMADREQARQLSGFVQMDDAYLGGELNGGKAGRGSQNKRPFVIAVSTNEERRPCYAVIEPVSGFTLKAINDWAQRRLAPGAEVYSDGLSAFAAVIDQGHAHTVISNPNRRAACESDNARWVNVVLSNLKRSLDGTYHAFKFFKYARRYLAEAAWRFNRRFRLKAILPSLIRAGARANPMAEHQLRNVPFHAG